MLDVFLYMLLFRPTRPTSAWRCWILVLEKRAGSRELMATRRTRGWTWTCRTMRRQRLWSPSWRRKARRSEFTWRCSLNFQLCFKVWGTISSCVSKTVFSLVLLGISNVLLDPPYRPSTFYAGRARQAGVKRADPGQTAERFQSLQPLSGGDGRNALNIKVEVQVSILSEWKTLFQLMLRYNLKRLKRATVEAIYLLPRSLATYREWRGSWPSIWRTGTSSR